MGVFIVFLDMTLKVCFESYRVVWSMSKMKVCWSFKWTSINMWCTYCESEFSKKYNSSSPTTSSSQESSHSNSLFNSQAPNLPKHLQNHPPTNLHPSCSYAKLLYNSQHKSWVVSEPSSTYYGVHTSVLHPSANNFIF